MKEFETIQSACRGSLQAYNQLVDRYQDDVYTWTCWLLKDDRSAEEATQRAFLQAFREIARFSSGSFRAWLLRIAVHTCRGLGLPRRAGSPPPVGKFQLYFMGLSPENQDTAFLVEILNLSYAEASFVQEVSPETIQERVAHARRHAAGQMRAVRSRAPAG